MVNLGTPEDDFVNMWKYLREFLSDRRIIELTRLIWYPILYGIIIVRPGKSENYIKVYDKKKRITIKSIYKEFTKLQKKYNREKVEFSFAMNYGFPKIRKELKNLKTKDAKRFLFFHVPSVFTTHKISSR